MSHDIPCIRAERFRPIPAELIIRAYLHTSKSAVSLRLAQSRLRKLIPERQTDAVVAQLLEGGSVTLERTLSLTANGRILTEKELGLDATSKWEVLWKTRLPLLALGLDANAKPERLRFARSDALKSAIIATAFGLAREDLGSPKVVASELVWRTLRARTGDLIGNGPFGMIDKPGPVERSLLGGLAGTRPKSFPDAMNALALKSVGLAKGTPDDLRLALIAKALALQVDEPRVERAHNVAANGAGFAANVVDVAKGLATPPFVGRVAIASVYDAYGKAHADAGSLASFKERLVKAAQDGALQLARLDMPERMSRDLRQRSETSCMSDQFHFVVTDWK